MKRTRDDWESISQKIYHVSNDSFVISNLVTELLYLWELDIMIDEYCTLFETWKAPTSYWPRITMLSRLFIIHAYEIIRCLDEFDLRRKDSSWWKLANFNTRRFQELRRKLEKIRVPLVKLEMRGENKSSFITIKWFWRYISFISQEGDELFMNQIIQEIFDTINNYAREKIQ